VFCRAGPGGLASLIFLPAPLLSFELDSISLKKRSPLLDPLSACFSTLFPQMFSTDFLKLSVAPSLPGCSCLVRELWEYVCLFLTLQPQAFPQARESLARDFQAGTYGLKNGLATVPSKVMVKKALTFCHPPPFSMFSTSGLVTPRPLASMIDYLPCSFFR